MKLGSQIFKLSHFVASHNFSRSSLFTAHVLVLNFSQFFQVPAVGKGILLSESGHNSRILQKSIFLNGQKYVPFYYWSKICPILLLVKNMSRKYVRRKNVPVPVM